jgi:hypothetical protein
MARLGPTEEEMVEVESVDDDEERREGRQLEVERLLKDLQADVLATSTLVQGKRTKAVPYTRRAPAAPATILVSIFIF